MRSLDTERVNYENAFNPIVFKIIKYLHVNKYATLSTIIQHCRSSYRHITRYLNILKKMNIVLEYRINKIRLYSLNYESAITQVYINFINQLEELFFQEM